MVYTNLKGGLGNMLFQIAASISIAAEKGVQAAFPNMYSQLDLINGDKVYNPSIDHAKEYVCMFGSLLTNTPEGKPKIYSYPFHYIPNIPEEKEFILDGFFQSEKYFEKNLHLIKETLKIPPEVSEIIKAKYSSLLSSTTTAVHVRRGDYLRYPNKHTPQTLNYYLRAIDEIENVGKIIVFSDDINWCKSNFIGERYHFIENEKDYIELYLMSKCNNVIISNSSFSWWGAWLNENKNKIIVGPKKWFGPMINHYDGDVMPKRWITI